MEERNRQEQHRLRKEAQEERIQFSGHWQSILLADATLKAEGVFRGNAFRFRSNT